MRSGALTHRASRSSLQPKKRRVRASRRRRSTRNHQAWSRKTPIPKAKAASVSVPIFLITRTTTIVLTSFKSSPAKTAVMS